MPRNVVQDVVIGGSGAPERRRRRVKREEPAIEETAPVAYEEESTRNDAHVSEAAGLPTEAVSAKSGPRNELVDLDDHPFFKKKPSRKRPEDVKDDHFLERRFAGGPPKKRSPRIFWFTAMAAAIGLAFGALFLFKGATVTVTPKNIASTIDSKEIAYKSPTPDQLGYDLMMLEGTHSSAVPASESQHVDKKATGTITIKNEYSSAPQKLIANTRFQTPEGLVYRISAPVTVPGQTKSGTGVVPGTVDAMIVADQPGDRYNLASATFTIPGFASDPRGAKITATAKTPLSGGFSGTLAQPKQADVDAAVATLKQAISDKLVASASSQKPDGFQLYDNAVFIQFDEPQILPNDEAPATAKVSLHGTLYGVLFDKKKFAQFLAKKQLGTLEPSDDLMIANMGALSFEIPNKDMIDPRAVTQIGFTLQGESHFVWNYDAQTLAQALAGRPKSEFNAILAQFPMIAKARSEFRPLGLPQTFPADPTKIMVIHSLE